MSEKHPSDVCAQSDCFRKPVQVYSAGLEHRWSLSCTTRALSAFFASDSQQPNTQKVSQTVQLQIGVFDPVSFKNAISQVLNAAIRGGALAEDGESAVATDYKVSADDILIVKAEQSALMTVTMVELHALNTISTNVHDEVYPTA